MSYDSVGNMNNKFSDDKKHIYSVFSQTKWFKLFLVHVNIGKIIKIIFNILYCRMKWIKNEKREKKRLDR